MAGNTKATAPAGQDKLATLPPAEGLRWLFERLCDSLLHHYIRFIQHGGEESLHDLRVSVRRLRSLLRNYRSVLHLDAVLLEQLRGLQQQTNQARDLEVFIAQLKRHCPAQPQLMTLQQQLESEYSQLRGRLPGEWAAILPRLQQPLSTNEHLEKFETQGALSGHIAARQLSRIKREFKALRRNWDEALIHRLRIDGKRIRYLLEPYSGMPRVDKVLRELRQMQDELGDYRDQQLLLLQLGTSREDDDVAGLITRLQAQRHTLVKKARRYQKRSRQQRLLHPVDGAVKILRHM